jgi:pimeloyl-ACP methyl ester carboxylesterase
LEDDVAEEFQIRSHGPRAAPILIYLPGLHGDWTLVGNFRRALGDRVHLLEVTYPRTLEWSLEEYAEATEKAIAQAGLTGGWLLGESFGSLVVWEMVRRRHFSARGVILAGGFVKHPVRGAARWMGRLIGGAPLGLLTRIMFGYARVTRARFGGTAEVVGELDEFVKRRTDLDRRAAVHRLQLVAKADYSAVAVGYSGPLYCLSGLVDPIVPWFLVKPWIKRRCTGLRAYRVIPAADHNVLGTASKAAAAQVLAWVNGPAAGTAEAKRGAIVSQGTSRIANE